MDYNELSRNEQLRRHKIAEHTRKMILAQLPVEGRDDTSLMADYRDYYLQISFSDLHPLMVFCLARALKKPGTQRQQDRLNDLNLHSILGSHAINHEAGCYSYRATQWLETELDSARFFEILNRCVDEADRGFMKLAA